ncbi:MAG: hypothetical protein KDA77_08275, partial [Planctomycetaceae bacterium]|nr:hypothetical protein [Planctomycetaceae bacterium]
LAKAGNQLFVADTNNHRICVVNLDDHKVSEFKIQGLTPPSLPKKADDSFAPAKNALAVAAQTVAAGSPLKISVTPKLPAEYKVSPLAPVKFSFKSATQQTAITGKGTVQGNQLVLELPALKDPSGTYTLNLRFGYCRDGVGGLCKQHSAHWSIPIQTVAGNKTTKISLPLDLSKE